MENTIDSFLEKFDKDMTNAEVAYLIDEYGAHKFFVELRLHLPVTKWKKKFAIIALAYHVAKKYLEEH